MNLFIPNRRATVLVPSGPAHDLDRKHLFIVLSRISVKKQVVIVNVSSIGNRSHYDKTCQLDIGDHPFIKHPSFVEYRRSRIESAQKLTDGVSKGIFTPLGILDENVFSWVCTGLEKSDFTPPKILKFYKENS